VLVDSNVIIRTLQPHHPLFAVADAAIQNLPQRGQTLHIAPQNLVEIWAVATRPSDARGGLGMTTDEAAAELRRIKALFTLLSETPALYPVWETLVVKHGVHGKQAHDARLVAAMLVHGVTAILTFNASDFRRYPGIQVVHPAEVAARAL
jgi:predicted nucleic acid-binding protein